jgi:Tol biopolymer transport system component
MNNELNADVSSTGILVYESNFQRESQLTWVDRSGKELSKVGVAQDERGVALAPDDNSAATVRRDQGIWVYDSRRGVGTRFTDAAISGNAPVWSPDGKWIAFGTGKRIYVQDSSGGSKEELLIENENDKEPSDWSRDGRYLIYTETDPKNQGDIWYLQDPLNRSADHKPVKFQATDAVESQAQLSPDGRWLAYISNASGEYQVYVRPFPSGPGRWKVSASGIIGREPRWQRDGKELFYLESQTPTIRVMAAAVKPSSGSEFQTSAPQPLFEFRAISIVPTFNNFLYSPSADGQRFLVHTLPSDAVPTLNVITNWEQYVLRGK